MSTKCSLQCILVQNTKELSQAKYTAPSYILRKSEVAKNKIRKKVSDTDLLLNAPTIYFKVEWNSRTIARKLNAENDKTTTVTYDLFILTWWRTVMRNCRNVQVSDAIVRNCWSNTNNIRTRYQQKTAALQMTASFKTMSHKLFKW